MNVALLIEFIRDGPWFSSAWALDLARGLNERGNHVTVLCGGVEDRAAFHFCTLLVHNDRRSHLGANPFAFRRWAERTLPRTGADGAISLSRHARAPLWCPVMRPARAELISLWRAHAPLSAAMETAHMPWLAPEILLERRLERAVLAPPASRRLEIGVPLPEHSPRPATSRAEPVETLGICSRLQPRTPDADAALCQRTRATLGIAAHRPVFLCSGVHADLPGLDAALAGFARVSRAAAPLLLILSRQPYSVRRAAARAGCKADDVLVLGLTRRIDALLCAANVAIAPFDARAGDRVCSTGRFIADALRLGRPVLATPYAGAASLLAAASDAPDPPGALVSGTPDAWAGAFDQALDPAWRAQAAARARERSPALDFTALLARLERAVCDPSALASVPASPAPPSSGTRASPARHAHSSPSHASAPHAS